MTNQKLLPALVLGAMFVSLPAYAQTATPTSTPTVTPTSTVTPTPSATATNTPIGTKPFRADNLETKIETWLGISTAPALAPANDGRVYYDTITQDWLCSKNGGPFASCAFSNPTPTAIVIPTATPLIDLLYSGKLNLGANASGTPLGRVTISANATPAPHDRVIICVNGTATPTPLVYTMPAATGSGRVIDMIVGGSQIGGGGPCMMNAGSDFMNDGHTDLLVAGWDADTCYDMAVGQWACRNLPEPTPTP